MSVAPSRVLWPSLPSSPRWRDLPAFRHWWQTLSLSILVILGCGLLSLVGKFLAQDTPILRGLSDPVSVAMRSFGYAHFLVALLFLVTSQRMQRPSQWAWFVGLLGMGCLLAYGYGMLDGWSRPPGQILILLYFAAHDFRDLVWFHRKSFDSTRANRPADARFLFWLQVLLFVLVVAALLPLAWHVMALRQEMADPKLRLDRLFPLSLRCLEKEAIVLLLVLVLEAGVAWGLVRAYPGRWRGLWCEHRPIILIALGYAAMVLSVFLVGIHIFSFLALSHFIGWYCLSDRALRSRPHQPVVLRHHPLDWIRKTVVGFRTLHLGLAGVFVVLIIASAYSIPQAGLLDSLTGRDAFGYWTILHISLSYCPR
jgi:hypothetical protein